MPDREELAVIAAFEEQLSLRSFQKRELYSQGQENADARVTRICCLFASPGNRCEDECFSLRGVTSLEFRSFFRLPVSACPQFWLKVVFPDKHDEAAPSVLVSSIEHHLSSWEMSARWPLQRNGHQAHPARLNARWWWMATVWVCVWLCVRACTCLYC